VALGPVPSAATFAHPIAPEASPAAIAALRCDPADQLFARMFNGLTEAAITNAGIQRSDVLNAMAADRATLKRYLESLGVAADDAQLDALMGGKLPGADVAAGWPASLSSCQFVPSMPSAQSRGR
jgi:hypothetical protein